MTDRTTDQRLLSRLDRYVEFDRVNRPYLEWQLDAFRPFLGQRILEIGCGVGGVLNVLAPRELLFGIDVEPEVLRFAEERFRSRAGFEFLQADAGRLSAATIIELQRKSFDTILCMNVLEHIADDVAAVHSLEQVLAPGGALVVLVPAHQALFGSYDALDGHYRRYSKRLLTDTLAKATSLRVLSVRYFNLIGAVGWWVQYKLLRKKIHGDGQMTLMNRLVPIFRRLETACAPPFGLSAIAVARRL